MKMANYTAALAIALTAFAGQSFAGATALAQSGAVNGQVAIVRGGQTLPLTSASALQAGDKLVAMENGTAEIRYADGCTLNVQSKSVATLGAQSPCAASHLVGHSSPMDLGSSDALVPFLTIFGVAGAFALIVSTEKSDAAHVTPTVLSP